MKLQAELKQTKPFVSLREEALLSLWRTADVLDAPLQQLFKSHGISRTQYNVLRILRGAGKSGIPSGEIAGRMLTRDPDVTRLIDRLERASLATRSRSASDRRIILVRISANGMKLLGRLDHPVLRVIEQTLGHVKDSRLRTLIRLLEELRQ